MAKKSDTRDMREIDVNDLESIERAARDHVEKALPFPGRERSLALTKLDEFRLWYDAAVKAQPAS